MNYYLFDNQEVKGPFSLSTIGEMLNSGDIDDGALVAAEGSEDWVPVAQMACAAQGSAEAGDSPQSASMTQIQKPSSLHSFIVTFFCTRCGTKLTAVPTEAGAHATCPSCGQKLAVPDNLDHLTVEHHQIVAPSPTSPASSPPTAPGARSDSTPMSILHTDVKVLLSQKWAIPGCLLLGLIIVVAVLVHQSATPKSPTGFRWTSGDEASTGGPSKHDYQTEISLDHQDKPDLSKYLSSEGFESRFENGFMMGACGAKANGLDDNPAFVAGYEYGKSSPSMPAYTEGENKGRVEGLTGLNLRSNPYNRISQTYEHLAWKAGYESGHMGGALEKALLR